MDITSQVIQCITGLQFPETANECNQYLFQFIQNPSNLECLSQIIQDSNDPYIINACLHFMRSSLKNFDQDLPPNLASTLFTNVLTSFSNCNDFSFFRAYKSLLETLLDLPKSDELTELLLSFYFNNKDTNAFTTIIIIKIIIKVCNIDQSPEILISFINFVYSIIEQIFSIQNIDSKAYFFSLALTILRVSLLHFSNKTINLQFIHHFVSIFINPDISFYSFHKIWKEFSSILVEFGLMNKNQKFLTNLISESSKRVNPFMSHYIAIYFSRYFKDRKIPFPYVKFFINFELITILKINNIIENDQVYTETPILKASLNYYNSEDEILEIYNHVKSLALKEKIRSSVTSIYYYGTAISLCFQFAKNDYNQIIKYFDNIFKLESNAITIFVCLLAFEEIFSCDISQCTNNFFLYFFERILYLTLSNCDYVRSLAVKLISAGEFSLVTTIDFPSFVIENRDNYAQKDIGSFFSLLFLCSGLEYPIPDSFYEECINIYLIPLIQNDISLLVYLSGFLVVNEMWIEPYLKLISPLLDSLIDKYIKEMTDGSFYRNYQLDAIINFFSINLVYYKDFFFAISQNYIFKLVQLFFKIDSLNKEFYISMANEFSISLKFINDQQAMNQLTDMLLNYLSNSPSEENFNFIYKIFYYTIHTISPERISSILAQITHILKNDDNKWDLTNYFNVLAAMFKNPSINNEIASYVSELMMEFFQNKLMNGRTYMCFFTCLSKIIRYLPNMNDWIRFIFSNLAVLQKKSLSLTSVISFIYSIIFNRYLPSNEFDEIFVQFAIQFFNDQNVANQNKSLLIMILSMMMEEKRSDIAYQFFINNIQSFYQLLMSKDVYLGVSSALIFFNAANMNIPNLDVKLINDYCFSFFPYKIIIDQNILFIKYVISIVKNNSIYSQYIQINILDALFKFLKSSLQKTIMIKKSLGPLYDEMIQCFVNLAKNNQSFIQEKLKDLDDFPSERKRILIILDQANLENNQC